MNQYKRVLTIAGSDSGGCAGIQADIKTITSLGCFASSAITAVTAQNTVGVKDVFSVPENLLSEQVESVLSDIGADAIKIGMLGTPEIVKAVTKVILKYKISKIVLDPVLVATSGDALSQDGVVEEIRENLLSLATIVTPNIPEGETISGCSNPDDMWNYFRSKGTNALLLKGGHATTDNAGEIVDVLYYNQQKVEYRHKKILTTNTHGTGCSLSSAIASYLALGEDLVAAVGKAIDWEMKAIESGSKFVVGNGHGPIDHFWAYR